MGRRVETTASVVEVAQVADLPEDIPEVAALITARLAAPSEQQSGGGGDDDEEEEEKVRGRSVLVAQPTGGTIVLKHALVLPVDGASALPETLLLAARLHHLCNEFLGTADDVAAAAGGGASGGDSSRRAYIVEEVRTLAAKAAGGGDLPASVELLALLDVINIVNVRVGLAEEEEGERGLERSEQESLIVEKVLHLVHMRLRRVVRRVLRKGVMPARAAPNVGELHLQLRQLEQGRPRVAKLCTLLMARIESSLAQAALGVTYMWLVGLLRHENAAQCCLCAEAWPLAAGTATRGSERGEDGDRDDEDGEKEDGTAFWAKALSDDEGGRNTFLMTYKEKMLTWGSWLVSQWALFETVNYQDISQFGKESVTLRNENSWSVPTRMALDLIARHQPLVEMGAGRGVWTELLMKRGVDIVAFDTLQWSDEFNDNGLHANGTALVQSRLDFVKEGAPDMLSREDAIASAPEYDGGDDRSGACTRALVLMWPDYMGVGTYGTECLRHYKGDTLVLVGEWRGRTCGSYTEGVAAHGQSFSTDFQDEVEAAFEEVETCRLPTWPLFFDSLMIWKRKSS